MRGTSTFKIVLASLFAALICVATMFIRIPSPVSGYLNLGDGFVLLSAFLLGPALGTVSAGIGSMLADLLSGYPMYAVGTLVIKGVVALIAATLCRKLGKGGLKSLLIAAIVAELWMTLGYFIYSGLCLSYGLGAAAEIPGNLCQGAAGIAVAAFLTPALMKSHEIREILEKLNR